MDEKKLSRRDVINLTLIARNGNKTIDERIKALDRLSNSSYFHNKKQKNSLIHRVIEKVIHLV
jgi:hypothetical protein